MRCDVTAPASKQDQPTDSILRDVLSLAEAEKTRWPALEIEARVQGPVCMAEDDEEPNPTPEAEAPGETDQPGDEESEAPDFLSAYDLGEVPEEARPVAEAAVKRLQAAYTKQRQEDTQAVRDAEQSRQIVDGLLDPQLAPVILERLGVQVGPPSEDEEEFDLGFETDESERLAAVEAQLAASQEDAYHQQVVAQENAEVTQQIRDLQEELDTEFTEDEIGLLYGLADEYRDAQGKPDVRAGYRVFDSLVTSANARAIKRQQGAARGTGRGRAASRQVDLSKETPEERRERMAAAHAAATGG